MRLTGKRMPFFLPLLLSSAILLSCENGDVSELFRTYDDPSDDTPVARCYSRPYTIILSWQPDEAADCFILCRAADDGLLSFSEIYRGTGTSYTDTLTGMEPCDRYLYRLDKMRGSRTFRGGSYACAVSSITGADRYEDNDMPERATELELSLAATMPCARFIWQGTVVYDADWYSVYVPAHRTATILLEQVDYGSDSSGSAASNTDFIWTEEDGVWNYIANNTPFTLRNRENEGLEMRFMVSPNLARVFSDTAGTRTLAYTLTLRGLE